MSFSISYIVKDLTDQFLDILYPRRCPVCGEIVMPKGALICGECFGKLSFVKGPVCKKCGKQVAGESVEYCYDCSRHKHSFEYGLALLNYDEAARHSMARIKYKNKRQDLDFYAEAVSQRYGASIKRMNARALVPVPIHASRRRQRGFNQAELLADGIGRKLGLPVWGDALTRNKKTAPQKKLSPKERLENLQQAFEIGTLPGERDSVILVDDIYTTGSTMEACTRILKAAGVRHVYFLTLCIGQEV